MQSTCDEFGVIIVSPDLPYQDGSEDKILSTLINAVDRSSGSDELAKAIVDWPTKYHFSRLRQELFTPFLIGSGMRVLEIGCGTGTNVRALAEKGAEVVGVEGTLSRARAARIRCLDMENVTIYAGDANDLPEIGLFDLVLLIGVLEYSASKVGGEGGPERLLGTAQKFLKPDGALILAIENQIGLKYLLSFPEDHLGVAWSGLEGYRNPSGIKTWSKHQLAKLLQENDFQHQEWFYPFPDYKLPTFIASNELFQSERGKSAVKNILRSPVVDHSANSELVCDPVWALQTLIDADIGSEISNSFLILASNNPASLSRFKADGLGWLASAERLSQWRQRRVLIDSAGHWSLNKYDEPQTRSSKSTSWLAQDAHVSVDFVDGVVLEDIIVNHLAQNDLVSVKNSLGTYLKFLETNIRKESSGQGFKHPFQLSQSTHLLDENMLDCIPRNIIVDESGNLHFVDTEWRALGGVSIELVWQRGLVSIAARTISTGITHPIGVHANVRDLVFSLSEIAGAPCSNEIIEKYIEAEADLQRLVGGSEVESQIRDFESATRWTPPGSRLGKSRQLLRSITELSQMTELYHQELSKIDAVVADRDAVVADRDAVVADRDAVSFKLQSELQILQEKEKFLLAELAHVSNAKALKMARLLSKPVVLLRKLLRL